jgi:hypothetical protein
MTREFTIWDLENLRIKGNHEARIPRWVHGAYPGKSPVARVLEAVAERAARVIQQAPMRSQVRQAVRQALGLPDLPPVPPRYVPDPLAYREHIRLYGDYWDRFDLRVFEALD